MTTVTEQEIAASAARTSIAEVAGYLQEQLGQQLTALMVSCRDGRLVGQWARGERVPPPKTATALRTAYQITRLLLQVEGRATVQSWFLGMNPYLDDEAPALVLTKDPESVLLAARTFVAVG